MVATVQTGTLAGIEAHGVSVEVSQARGLPGFDIVGLPEAALRESRVRVLAALVNSGIALPDRRFIVNLAPADLRKSGASFDLAIAIALAAACGLCAATALEHTLILGELSLDGRVRPVRGILAQLRSARERGLRHAIVPAEDAGWAGLVTGMHAQLATHLSEVVATLNGVAQLPTARPFELLCEKGMHEDLRDVCGQAGAKRALEVAAAGGHNLLMLGPPGAGKTMLARRLCGILPPANDEEALEIATIASVAGTPSLTTLARPMRAPHHSCSEAALIGGGDPIRPGEVTLAHGGVLFLDELPEFRRNVVEALRPTMESGLAVVVRAKQRVSMPARPLIVAAMNPCPCGYAGDPKRVCRCSPEQAQRYRARVSGPVIDRFDIHIQLPPVSAASLSQADAGDSSAVVRERVSEARARAYARASVCDRSHTQGIAATLDDAAHRLLVRSIDALGLSLRAYAKVLRVARTIADLEGRDGVGATQVAEAVQYRLLDREPPAHEGMPLMAANNGANRVP